MGVRDTTRSERGFSLLEVLASLSLTLIIVLSLYGLVDVNQRISRDQQHVATMQQNGRAALEFMVRDLHTVGYKLVNNGALDSFGVIFPNGECNDTHLTDAITIWSNPGEAEGTVTRDMPQPSSELVLDSVGDFVEGDQAVIIGLGSDGLLHFDIFIVTEVQDNNGVGELHLQHRPPINPDDFTTCYQAGSKVLIVDTISYYLQTDADGVKELYRKFRGRPASPVATHVTGLLFRYYGEGIPPVELTGIDTTEERHAIREVEITLSVETEKEALQTGEHRIVSWKSKVAPRNLLYKRNI